MELLYSKYALRKDLTENKLIKFGFHHGKTYRTYVYKDILQLIIEVDFRQW